MKIWTKEDIKHLTPPWTEYRKKVLTKAMRLTGAFKVMTREGPLECPDGYLAIDSDGWPYPIAKHKFEKIYEVA